MDEEAAEEVHDGTVYRAIAGMQAPFEMPDPICAAIFPLTRAQPRAECENCCALQPPWLLLRSVSRRWDRRLRPRVQSTRTQSRTWVRKPLALHTCLMVLCITARCSRCLCIVRTVSQLWHSVTFRAADMDRCLSGPCSVARRGAYSELRRSNPPADRGCFDGKKRRV